MVCNVLVGEPYVVPSQNDGNSLIVPPGRADTTMSSNGRVYVKYNDNDFYPLYFAYYRRIPEHTTKSKYFHANSRRNMDHDDYDDDNYDYSSYDVDEDMFERYDSNDYGLDDDDFFDNYYDD